MFVGTGSYRLSKKRAVGSRDVLEYRIKSVLFLLKAKFYKKKVRYPVYGTGIQTQGLQNMSLVPKPLDQWPIL